MTKQYVQLTNVVIDDDVLKHLLEEEVTTRKEKVQLQDLKPENRMERLLDKIIFPSLEAESSQKYISLVNVMNRSEDATLRDIASKLIKSLH